MSMRRRAQDLGEKLKDFDKSTSTVAAKDDKLRTTTRRYWKNSKPVPVRHVTSAPLAQFTALQFTILERRGIPAKRVATAVALRLLGS